MYMFLCMFVSDKKYTILLLFRYCDILHRSAMHLGGWSKLDSRASQAPFNNWSSSVLWPQGAHVRLSKDLYRAEGYTNAAEPNNSTHARFFVSFSH